MATALLVAFPCLVLGPSAAQAWTEANVQSVAAHVQVDPTGQADVSLTLTVRIGGGWLEGIDIDGLDPDLVLSEEKPPWAVSATDPELEWSPRVRVQEEGRIRLSFPGRGSPRRGTLLIGINYTTELAERGIQSIDDARVRISWTLPGWRTGIDGVEVTLVTPVGAEPASAMEDGPEAADELAVLSEDGASIHSFRRIHLPRTVPWTVSVDLPASAVDPALRGPSVAAPRPTATATEAPIDGGAIPLVLFVLFVALMSRASFAASCRKRGATARPVVGGPLWLVIPGAAALAVLAVRHAATTPIASIALVTVIAMLSLQRSPVTRRSTHVAFTPCTPAQLGAARRRLITAHAFGSPVLDLTTGLGSFLLVAILWAAAFLGGVLIRPTAFGLACLGLVAIPFATATRYHLPGSPDAHLVALFGFARRAVHLGPVTLRPVLGRGETPSAVEARLRLLPTSVPDGLIRLDVVMVERPVLGGFETCPALLVTTSSASEAEDRVAALSLAAPAIGPEGRRARLVMLGDDADDVICAVASALAALTSPEERALLVAA